MLQHLVRSLPTLRSALPLRHGHRMQQGASHCFGSAPARRSSKNGCPQGVVWLFRRKVDHRSLIGHETISLQRSVDLADALGGLRGPAQRLDTGYLPILYI